MGFKVRAFIEVKDDLEFTMERTVKDAVVAYVKAGSKAIPSLTGQARASYLAMARSLGLQVPANYDEQPHSIWRKRDRVRLSSYGNTPSRGESMGIATLELTNGRLVLDMRNFLTSAHNDYPYIASDRWGAHSEAKRVFREQIREEMAKGFLRVVRSVISNG